MVRIDVRTRRSSEAFVSFIDIYFSFCVFLIPDIRVISCQGFSINITAISSSSLSSGCFSCFFSWQNAVITQKSANMTGLPAKGVIQDFL